MAKTLEDLLIWAEREFNQADLCFGHGTDNAWDEAVWLALHVLCLRYDTSAEIAEKYLSSAEEQAIVSLVEKRINERIPAAYLTNEIWFAGLSFYIDKRTIIPRSPIAELIINNFQPWLGNKNVLNILDLCTGSGCIAIACAKMFPDAQIDATDISQDALEIAKINIERHQINKQINLIKSDVFNELGNKTYDLIISNPPYVSDKEISELPKEYQHEPNIALAGDGNDGLAIVDRIIREFPKHLTDNGLLIMDIGNNTKNLLHKYPELPFIWPELANGGDGVFVLINI